MKRPEPRITFLIISIFVAVVFHFYFGTRAFYSYYNASEQKSYIQEIWVPANAEVFTDKKALEAKLGDVEYSTQMFQLPAFKELFAKEKTYVSLGTGTVMYLTVHGNLALHTPEESYPGEEPPGTLRSSATYLGEGKVEFQLERIWGEIICMTLAIGFLKGLLVDAAIAILWLIWFVKGEIATARRLAKEAAARESAKPAV